MKIISLFKYLLAIALVGALAARAQAQTSVPSTFKHITIDGSFGDWAGVPLAYTAPPGDTNAIQYQNVYLANDAANLYVRFTLYAPRANAFANSYDNVFIDGDNDPSTGFSVGGIGSSMLVQWGGGYQETNGFFNIGAVNNLGWALAGSPDSTDFEFSISLAATFAANSNLVFSNATFALLLEGDNTNYINTIFAPTSGGLVYTLATTPTSPASNLSLVSLTNSTWTANAAGADLGTNWLDSAYDDTVTGWTSGHGLFGYTTTPGSYPAIHTALANTAATYYFRTHFQWTNDTANVAFVVTNFLSDGAVYYLNGAEVKRVRMPAGTVSYATPAAATNSPVGHADVFGIDGGTLQYGDNILEVETHQAAGSASDLVFGLSLTAAIQYPVLIVNTNLPANAAVVAGQPVTFTTDIIGSGPLTYQWFYNGTNAIAGANTPSYTIPQVLNNNAGTYSVQVSNQLNSVNSRTATLTVSNIAISIYQQPTNQFAVQGKPVVFTVGVTNGTPIILYQWLFGGNPITNATNASYVINSCAVSNAGTYQVIVSNPAGTVPSATATLSVLLDRIPPKLTSIVASAGQILITFSEPVDSVTSADATKYSISGGISVVSAVQNPADATQVTLTVTPALNFGSVYTLTVNGVKDLFGNVAHDAGQFTRGITIDGSFDDWSGLVPVYSSTAPSGNLGAADFKDIYAYNDANYYYFRVTLWADIDPGFGQFPYYVNMFFDTDNNSGTGYSAIGSDLLVQSGYSYQEKNGGFNDNFPINALNWLCLPVAPGTNFEFRLSRAATFADNSPVFPTNQVNFIFQGMTPGFVVENTVPPTGVLSYTNVSSTPVATLPLGRLDIQTPVRSQAVLIWDQPGTLQQSSTLTPGSWTTLPSAVSPYVITATPGTKQFFRLVQ